MSAIATLKQEFEDAKKAFVDRGKELFLPAAQELFDAYPSMDSFQWSQYTPYFMDGDPCEFGVNADDYYLSVNGVTHEDNEATSEKKYEKNPATGNYESSPNEAYDPNIKAQYDAVSKFVYSVPEEVMQALYGDHVEVTVYRDGRIETEDCEHD